jgi:hypothetical protein
MTKYNATLAVKFPVRATRAYPMASDTSGSLRLSIVQLAYEKGERRVRNLSSSGYSMGSEDRYDPGMDGMHIWLHVYPQHFDSLQLEWGDLFSVTFTQVEKMQATAKRIRRALDKMNDELGYAKEPRAVFRRLCKAAGVTMVVRPKRDNGGYSYDDLEWEIRGVDTGEHWLEEAIKSITEELNVKAA